jgi:hypothetical protein
MRSSLRQAQYQPASNVIMHNDYPGVTCTHLFFASNSTNRCSAISPMLTASFLGGYITLS